MTHLETRHCTVYQGRGQQALSADDSSPEGVFAPEKTTLHDIMCTDLVCARSDLEVSAMTHLMLRHHIGCIPIVDQDRRPIGMITELDVVELLETSMNAVGPGFALPPEIATKRAEQVMQPIALALDEHTDIARAASMMLAEQTHHVLAVSWDGVLVGVVSAKDIVAWFLESDTPARSKAHSHSTWRSIEG